MVLVGAGSLEPEVRNINICNLRGDISAILPLGGFDVCLSSLAVQAHVFFSPVCMFALRLTSTNFVCVMTCSFLAINIYLRELMIFMLVRIFEYNVV